MMKQGTMNILFFVLKTKTAEKREAPILMRITINEHYDEVRIQRSVPLKNLWNAAKDAAKAGQGISGTERLYCRPARHAPRKAQGAGTFGIRP